VFFILFSTIHARIARAYREVCPIAHHPRVPLLLRRARVRICRADLTKLDLAAFRQASKDVASRRDAGYKSFISRTKKKGEGEEKKRITLRVADTAARDKQRFPSHRDFRSAERSLARARAILPRPEKFLFTAAA